VSQFGDKFTGEYLREHNIPNKTKIKTDYIEEKINEFDKNFRYIIKQLNKQCNFSFWIARNSAKEAVSLHKIQDEKQPIFLGVVNLEHKKALEKIIDNNNKTDIRFETVIDKNVKKTKPEIFNDTEVNVPLPVVPYLNELYGKDWKVRHFDG